MNEEQATEFKRLEHTLEELLEEREQALMRVRAARHAYERALLDVERVAREQAQQESEASVSTRALRALAASA